jgi:hypothetical protein
MPLAAMSVATRTRNSPALKPASALFSRRFRRGLQGSWPLQFRAMRRLRRRAAKRFRAATEVVRRRQGSDLDPLFEDADQSFSGTST